MIFLAAGTEDGRILAKELTKQGFEVIISVVSNYGKSLIKTDDKLKINDRILKKDDLREFLLKNKIKIFIDATHPYATHISQTAMDICEELSIYYLRYERPITPLPNYEKLILVKDYEKAAKKAFEVANNVFLTTGSRHLKEFSSYLEDEKNTLFVRVLPVIDSLQACLDNGISPKYTIAMQGPFSEELNLAMFRQAKAEAIVLKNSGRLGGTDTKIKAAIKDDLYIIIIDRPDITYKNVVNDFNTIIKICSDVVR